MPEPDTPPDTIAAMRAAVATMRHVNRLYGLPEDAPMQASWLEHEATVLEVPF